MDQPPRLGFWSDFWRRHPAVVLLVLLAAGIALANLLPIRPWDWLITAALLSLGGLLVRWKLFGFASLGCAALFVGLSAAQIERFQFPSNTIANYTTEDQRLAQLELAIDQPPRLIQPDPAELRSILPKQTIVATARRIDTVSGWRNVSGKVFLLVEHPNPRLAAGQIVRADGMLMRPQGASNPGEFDFAAWCRDQRILASFRIEHASGITIVRDDGPGPLVWLREKARHLLAMGFSADQAFDHALLRAFVLGDSDPQLRDLEQKFVRTGTVHDLAISGLHVAIIGALALLICRLLRLRPGVSAGIALAAVLLYGAVATPSWPGWRSIILCAAATVGLLGRRSLDAIQMFALAVAAVLLIHPADLHNEGFQVSFAAVLGMILLSRRIEEFFWAWWRGRDRPTIRPRKPIAAVSIAAWRFLVGASVASFIAWGMSMPLIAYHFRQLNVWSVPAGVALLPLTVVALAAGVGKILLTLLWPGAAHFWAAGAVIPVLWMRQIVDWLDRMPGASVVVPPIPLQWLLAYYAMFLLLLLPIRRAIWRWLTRLASTAGCAGVLLVPTIVKTPSPSPGGLPPLHIMLVSLGAGQCAIVRPASRHAVLIDAGSSISDVAQSVLEPCLRAENVSYIDRIFLSDDGFDYISAAEELFDQYDQPPIFISPYFTRHAFGNLPAEALLETLRDSDRPPTIVHQGDHLKLAGGAVIDVLWPPVACNMNSSNCGLVLKLTYAGKSVLFTAGIQEPAEIELLKHSELLRADVLVAPHHGSAEIATARFIAAVHPRMILASNSFKLTQKQKLFDAVARGYPLYRTSQYGAIDVTIEPTGTIELRTFLGVSPKPKGP